MILSLTTRKYFKLLYIKNPNFSHQFPRILQHIFLIKRILIKCYQIILQVELYTAEDICESKHRV